MFSHRLLCNGTMNEKINDSVETCVSFSTFFSLQLSFRTKVKYVTFGKIRGNGRIYIYAVQSCRCCVKLIFRTPPPPWNPGQKTQFTSSTFKGYVVSNGIFQTTCDLALISQVTVKLNGLSRLNYTTGISSQSRNYYGSDKSKTRTEVKSGKQSAYNCTTGISVYELYCSGDVNILVLEDISGIKRESWK